MREKEDAIWLMQLLSLILNIETISKGSVSKIEDQLYHWKKAAIRCAEAKLKWSL